MKERRFSSYHSNGIIVGDNEKWIFVNEENMEKMNDLIEKLMDDKTCHRKKSTG
jgi:hypothetical protein